MRKWLVRRFRLPARPDSPDIAATDTSPCSPNPTPADPDEEALCFGAVLNEELKEIGELRKKRGAEQQKGNGAGDVSGSEVRREIRGLCSEDPITAAEATAAVFSKARDMELVGLAFSGGGIRSATFNLGVLQGLAKYRLLRKFDYFSTVSGGGYIGSWLEAWIFRAGQPKERDETAQQEGTKPKYGIDFVEQELNPARSDRPGRTVTMDGQEVRMHTRTEPRPIRFLREYSNYLTPRLGLLGADTWTMVAVYLRNLLLNQVVLTLFLFSLLLLPHTAVWLTDRLSTWPYLAAYYPAPIAVVVLVTLALCLGAVNLRAVLNPGDNEAQTGGWFPQQQGWILATIIVPLFAAAWILTGWIWSHEDFWNGKTPWSYWAVGGLLAVSVPWIISCAFAPPQNAGGDDWELRHRKLSWVLVSLIAGPLSGLLLYAVAAGIFKHLEPLPGSLWHEVSFGVPLVMMVFLLAAVLQMGLMGRTFDDPYREWWARVAGWIFILTIVWGVGFGLAIYAPLGLLWLRGWLAAAGIGWLATTLLGVIGGNSAKTGALQSKTVKDTLLSVTPYVFVAGLVSLLSLSLELILARLNWSCDMAVHWDRLLAENPPVAKVAGWVLNLNASLASPTPMITGTAAPQASVQVAPTYVSAHWAILRLVSTWHLPLLFAGVFLVCVLMAWRVDLNEFSMHLFYRNRLVRCYLGATHADRDPNPFTGFDDQDDLFLKDLQSECCYSGPFPIFNATLNLVNSRDLAWQERKAESFSMTPLRCGYDTWLERLDLSSDYSRERKRREKLAEYAYRTTQRYGYKDGGFYTGTAVGISGAALSPNMGFHSQPALAALMTLFNVRLGFWAGNPRHSTSCQKTRPGPPLGLRWLLAELFGLTDDEGSYVYLSDGGHFENLGVYELVKRRCKYIIACDAGADPNYALDDLGSAIRRCREDIGVEIDLDLVSKMVVPPPAKDGEARKLVPWHCFVGEIRYDMVDAKDPKLSPRERRKENGIFVYVKASLRGDEPADVLNYQTAHKDFPHETTADQWFSESQFESYRRLGLHIVETMLGALDPNERAAAEQSAKGLFEGLENHWGEKEAGKKQAASQKNEKS